MWFLDRLIQYQLIVIADRHCFPSLRRKVAYPNCPASWPEADLPPPAPKSAFMHAGPPGEGRCEAGRLPEGGVPPTFRFDTLKAVEKMRARCQSRKDFYRTVAYFTAIKRLRILSSRIISQSFGSTKTE